MTVATLGIALPDIRQSLSLSEVAAGGLFSVIFVVAAISSNVAGRLSDKIGRKKVLICGLTTITLGFTVAGVSQNHIAMLLFLGVTGLGYGFIPTSLYTIMSELRPEHRGLGASLVAVSYGIGGATGSVLASRAVAYADWRAAFIIVGAIAAAITLLQLWRVQEARRSLSERPSVSFQGLFSRSLILLALAEFMGGSVFWSSAAWTATLLRTAKALSITETGWVMGAWSLSQMVGALSLGALSDKIGSKAVILWSAFPSAVVSFLVYYWLASSGTLAAGLLLFGTLRASAPTLVVTLAQRAAPAGSAGTATGMVMSMHYVSAVIAPLIAAKVITGTADIIIAMILMSSIPMLVYGCLIIGVQARHRAIHA